ncbi:related to DUF967 domain protein [Cephalotrichum gorgonifer]|uniref:Related to DUF967 domain protein n=1 Tax=Cephalotrichum gorgonifer TaxID=2041049 RepID=A0AAE8N3W6_9PEZI|nr:related to DUF967 domain protein [Cephalotrichum gorgonifer]
MSHQVLRRRSAIGAGHEAAVKAVRNLNGSAVTINSPPEDVETLTARGDSFTFDAFTSVDAWELGNLLYARLAPEPRPALISITLANGLTVFQTTTGAGVNPDNEVWVQRKRRSVMRWGCSSWFLNCKYAGDQAAFAAKFGLSDEQAAGYAIHGGAIPIRVRGVEGLVAVVVVSGLKQHEDHGVIVDVVEENWEPVA